MLFKFSPVLYISVLMRSSGSRFASTNMHVFTQKRNPITGSTEWDVQHEDYDYHQEIARSAFADMLHDTERNKKYYLALKMAIEKMHSLGKRAKVLDIGTGTGLLSIMAAKSGADSITACEAFRPMAECCLKILKHNKVAHKIKVIPKRSTDLTVGKGRDMREKANILVTEVFDTELIGEGALSTFNHAHKFLLEEDCIVIPDSAVVYAQVVQCPTLQKWNKLNDLADEDLEIILRTPKNMKDCPGSASVHDIQLSQLPRETFRELSEKLPIFRYNWSRRNQNPLTNLGLTPFIAAETGKAQMVFMWWELNMDPEGKLLLSCAPWWNHPDADVSSERPQDTIPWRDHWMQAVYFLPEVMTLEKGTKTYLISCQDEYSIWFYLDENRKKSIYKDVPRPVCNCGVHMTLSRTHVSYLNDGRRSKKFLSQLKDQLVENAVVLDLNGSSLMGLASAKLGAKQVFIREDMNINKAILNDYIEENELKNVTIVSEVNDKILKAVTNVICDPNFNTSVLPWENLKVAYLLYKYRNKLGRSVSVLPEGFELWGMPVEFQNLHKIRVPLEVCEGIDMSIFDILVENSRLISDAAIEAQPLWEYPCFCRGLPRKMLDIEMSNLMPTFAKDGTNPILDTEEDSEYTVNGFALWARWRIGGQAMSSGPLEWPVAGRRVEWDPHTRQAVKILKNSHKVSATESWTYQVVCDLNKGEFDITVDLE